MISVATLICAQYDAPVDDPDVYDDGTWYGTYGFTLSNRMKRNVCRLIIATSRGLV